MGQICCPAHVWQACCLEPKSAQLPLAQGCPRQPSCLNSLLPPPLQASPAWLERLLRPVCTEMGCSAGCSDRPLTGLGGMTCAVVMDRQVCSTCSATCTHGWLKVRFAQACKQRAATLTSRLTLDPPHRRPAAEGCGRASLPEPGLAPGQRSSAGAACQARCSAGDCRSGRRAGAV